MASPKDKDELVINPTTSKLDMVRKFNPDRIVTSEFNSAGSPRVAYDPASNTFVPDGATVVVDDDGNVVVV